MLSRWASRDRVCGLERRAEEVDADEEEEEEAD